MTSAMARGRRWTAFPVADRNQPRVQQLLTDLTGDGRLDWVTAQPGIERFPHT